LTEKNKEIKEYIRSRDNGICQCCGKYCWNNGNVAHRIAQTKTNIKIYGKKVIDHTYNKVWTCFSFNCNDSFNVGNNPGKCNTLVHLINKQIDVETKKITKILNNY